ncbi:MAG: M48 family metalloprotease [Bacillota bacterium]
MFCSKCGTELPAEAAFCWRCGAKVEGQSKPAEARPADASLAISLRNGATVARESPRQLMSYQYEHPDDARGTELIKAASPVIAAARALITNWNEPALKAQLLGNAVKVGPEQYPEIYAVAVECAQILNIDLPDVFIKHSPYFNAMTFGVENPFVILHSALVDGFDREELHFIIGHEMGHIKNKHVLYLTTAYILTHQALALGQSLLPIGQILAVPARAALDGWQRSAELTADRAGLIATQDLQVSLKSLVKLAVGSRELAQRLNFDEYLRQAEQAERHGMSGPVQTFENHPMVARRVRLLRDWAGSPDYRALWPSRASEDAVSEPEEREKVAAALLEKAMAHVRRGSSLAGMWLALGGDTSPIERALKGLETVVEEYGDTRAGRKAIVYRAAAEMHLRRPYEALIGFEGFVQRYPDDPLAAEAQFHAARLYDQTLHDPDLAKAAYGKLLEHYPDSPWTKEARAALRHLGRGR